MTYVNIEYYNVGIYKGDTRTSISFIDFINKVEGIIHIDSDIKNKKELKEEYTERKVRIINDKHCTIYKKINKENSNFIMAIGKFRLENKPFISDLYSSRFEELEKDIVELVTLVYISKNNIIALETNSSGLKYKEIEEYFNSFFVDEGSNSYRIEFNPIMYKFEREKIRRTNKIKSFSLGINVSDIDKKLIKKEYYKEYQNDTNHIVHGLIRKIKVLKETAPELNADEILIQYKNTDTRLGSRSNENTMNIYMINQIIDIIDYENNDTIKSLKLNYEEDGKSEEIDLSLDKLFLKNKIYLNEPNAGPEFIGEKIIESLKNIEIELSAAQLEYDKLYEIDSSINKVPKLLKKPKIEYRFNIQQSMLDNME